MIYVSLSYRSNRFVAAHVGLQVCDGPSFWEPSISEDHEGLGWISSDKYQKLRAEFRRKFLAKGIDPSRKKKRALFSKYQ